MPSDPLVSIIITCFNYGRYVKESINSALEQKGAPFEIIVIDDGSTDNSWDIIDSFDDRVQAYRTENQGFIKACMYGFSLSKGQFILFLDADDVLYPYALLSVAEFLEPNVSKIQYQLDPIGPAGKRLGLSFPHLNKSNGSPYFMKQVLRRGYLYNAANFWKHLEAFAFPTTRGYQL